MTAPRHRSPSVPVVGRPLRPWLAALFLLFGLLAVDSLYLVGVTLLEAATGRIWQDYLYQLVFLAHLVLGLLLLVPFVVFVPRHLRRAWPRPNRRAVQAGLALAVAGLLLLVSGVLLTRLGLFEIDDPRWRRVLYWVHVITPLLVAWLFVLHRLAGRAIRWRLGLRWAGVAVAFAALMVVAEGWQHQRRAEGAVQVSLAPALTRLPNGYIPAERLNRSEECVSCHADFKDDWQHSMHHLSSFNNPVYRFSVLETIEYSERENVPHAARLCAACHDPVLLLSGKFDRPPEEIERDPDARAGITCTVCHAIERINSPRGNGDYSIRTPGAYPFEFSDNRWLRALGHQLIKAKPEFHKKTFLKPLHRSAEFCSVCHKVHLPAEFNRYKWLRGQNHYDSWLLSGVSGHGVTSFYYPPRAVTRCALCHMPLKPSDDFAARYPAAPGQAAEDDQRYIHDHLFGAANTGVPHLLGMSDDGNARRRAFLEGVARVDIFGLREDGRIDGALHAPLRPRLPALQPGRDYLLETVVRTLKLGHWFTQGTTDSNEPWLDVTVRLGDRVIGRSGALDEDGDVDPWAYFLNTYLLDRQGRRIERRNAQDIFVPLYNHQIPPGAAEVVHYRFRVPEDARGELTVEVRLQYRKFDTRLMRHVLGERFERNDLPIVTIAEDRVTLPIAPAAGRTVAAPEVPAWERWNDYGIGLLRKGSKGSAKGELRQAEAAFRRVEVLGRPDGPLNLTRVYLKEGRLEEATAALRRAARHDPPAPPWSVAWFSGLLNKQQGFLEAATRDFESLVDTRFREARARGFDFSRDTRLLNELGETLYQRARRARGPDRQAERQRLLQAARQRFEQTLAIDPENAAAHYNLALILHQLGERQAAAEHRRLHRKYKADDNAADRVVALHRRRHPAADHAANAIAIYDLQRGAVADTRLARQDL